MLSSLDFSLMIKLSKSAGELDLILSSNCDSYIFNYANNRINIPCRIFVVCRMLTFKPRYIIPTCE